MRPDPIAREHTCLQALRALEATEGVLIGGYAVSAYGPPRFSVDLDIVLPAAIAPPVREVLEHDGFRLEKRWIPRDAPVGFSEKWVLRDVSVDLLIDGVADRRSGTWFPYQVLRTTATRLVVQGGSTTATATPLVASREALIALKLVVGRLQDQRDVAILARGPVDIDAVWKLLGACRRDVLRRRVEALLRVIESQNFEDSLKGVYQMERRSHERYLSATRDLCRAILDRPATPRA